MLQILQKLLYRFDILMHKMYCTTYVDYFDYHGPETETVVK